MALGRIAQAHPRVTAEKAAEMLGPGQGPVLARRRDLQRVTVAVFGELPGHALAQLERDPVRMVDEQPQGPATDDLRKQHLDSGIAGGEPRLDLILQCTHGVLRRISHKKSGPAPTCRILQAFTGGSARPLAQELSVAPTARSFL